MFYNIQLPDNKSLRLRQMMSAWVLRKEILALTDRDCHDVCILHRALLTIAGASDAVLLQPCVVDVEDCGAAYRFLFPLLAITPGHWLLTGTPRLLQRPIMPLVQVLQSFGADISETVSGWVIVGKPLCARELEIDARQSSQMASALVLNAPLYGLQTVRLTSTQIPSLSYLRMTLACTREFPIRIPDVDVPDKPIGAMGDWSAALFWFSHARLHPENSYSLTPLSINSIQGDSVIFKWFSDLNIAISTNGLNVDLQAKPLEKMPEMVLDVQECLDTVPVMAAMAALLPADITFCNVHNLQYKESDRLLALAEQLQPFAEIVLTDDRLRVRGLGDVPDGESRFDTRHDHRLAMAFLLFDHPEWLTDTDCLRKSYPGLLHDLKAVQNV